MRQRIPIWVVLVALAGPAWAQFSTFRIASPPSQRAVAGVYTVGWRQDPERIDNGPCSVTWYYSTRPDGSDRRRLTTSFRDDFSRGFLANWSPQGPFLFDWSVRSDPADRRSFLYGPPGGGPLISNRAAEQDMVLSVLVRPRSLRNQFRLELRVQRGGRSYELRNTDGSIQILSAGRVIGERRVTRVTPLRWYWYEVGVRSVKRKDVEIRARILDEKRQQLLASLAVEERPQDPALLQAGGIALWGPADFAEVYVDPWSARWCDGSENQIRWDTTGVANGDYYLLAELHDDRHPSQTVASDFQVQVRNAGQ